MNKMMTARDIMVSKVWRLRPNQSAFDGIAWLIRHNITGAPVVDGERFLGMFSEKCSLSLFSTAVMELTARTGTPVGGPEVMQFAAGDVLTLSPEADVFVAIGHLLKHKISGAPVMDAGGNFLGVFSEKTSMRVVIGGAYEQLPSTSVGCFMDRDQGRLICDDANLWTVAGIFASTRYRRLLVLRNGSPIGQVSRRDVLKAGYPLMCKLHRERYASSDAVEESSCKSVVLESPVSMAMDVNARTVSPDADWTELANIFNSTNYRQVQVLDDDRRLLGQISRHDLLSAVYHTLDPQKKCPDNHPLYLSAVKDQEAGSFW